MAKKTEKKAQEPLTAHGLLGSLSYWGTTARFMMTSVFLAFAFVLNLTGSTSSWYVDGEILFLVVGLATLLMLDLGYVVAARAMLLNKVADRWIVMMSDLLVAAFFVVPSLVETGVDSTRLRITSLVVALLVVSVRILVGLLFSKRK